MYIYNCMMLPNMDPDNIYIYNMSRGFYLVDNAIDGVFLPPSPVP